jgi:hypothetical protein
MGRPSEQVAGARAAIVVVSDSNAAISENRRVDSHHLVPFPKP